jgi:NhaP-type Na+/H+ or K+/H+ antiporter
VPTIILTGASIDDVFAITAFSAFLGLATSNNINILREIASIPLSIVLGIIPGIVIGIILVLYFKKKYKDIRATEKTLLLLAGAMMLVQIGDWLHSAALLGVMTAGFIILEKSEKVAHEISLKLSKIWVFAAIILFVLIGYSVDVRTILNAGLKGLAIIAMGLIFRSVGVIIATSFSKLSLKEKVFCIIAYIPKATVQAALGGVALSIGLKEGHTILALAVLSIIFTAPIGLIGIKLFGHRLLHIDFPE